MERIPESSRSVFDSVESANAAFYKAMETNDMELMSKVWEVSDRITCTHPGRSRIDGHEQVLSSFRRIFDYGQMPQIFVTEISIALGQSDSWISLVENFFEPVAGAVSALNLFHFDQSVGWKMVVHHAAPIMVRGGQTR